MEACLELSGSEAVVAMQDLGAAGLTCALAELSARGGCGAEVLLDLVPVRETEMTGYELLLSESQERMLLVVKAGHEESVRQAFARFELHAVPIGRVIEEPVIRARYRGELVCEVPGRALADDAPRYVLPAAPPVELEGRRAERLDDLAAAMPDGATLLALLASPNVRSRRPVWRRYDHMNGTNTLVGPGGGDAAVLRVKGTPRALALSIDGPGRLGALDPRLAGAAAVLEGALNVACSGAEPIGITNCLNFGSPETPAGLLAAGRGGGRDGRCVPCARPADRVGQRQPLQRDAGRPDPADPGGRHGRPARGPITPGADALARGRRDLAARRRRRWTRARWPRPSWPGGAAGAAGRRGWRWTPARRWCGCWSRWPRRHPGRRARPVGRWSGGGPGAHGDRLRSGGGGQPAAGRRGMANGRALRRAHRTRPGGRRVGRCAARGRGGGAGRCSGRTARDGAGSGAADRAGRVRRCESASRRWPRPGRRPSSASACGDWPPFRGDLPAGGRAASRRWRPRRAGPWRQGSGSSAERRRARRTGSLVDDGRSRRRPGRRPLGDRACGDERSTPNRSGRPRRPPGCRPASGSRGRPNPGRGP